MCFCFFFEKFEVIWMVIWSVLSRFCFELEAKAIDTGAVWSRCEVGQGGLRKAHCRNSLRPLQFEVM